MTVGAAGALGVPNTWTMWQPYAQTPGNTSGSAILQAFASTYAGLTNRTTGLMQADGLSALAGSGALPDLIGGMYSIAKANGSNPSTLADLQASVATMGGWDTTAASILFSGDSSNAKHGWSAAALGMNTALALASYADRQQGIPNGTAAAAAAASAGGSPQTAIQSGQSAMLQSMLDLLG
ncbi:hypothetical protein GETHLI_15350 [Geothrix limicola]|uniref:Uncharacterized protein n=1 Tax=Geothrix limicola TaxID=2927978 RepID=A0ABQ5QF88_9BACT|nr:hypothetical protein [Geothrix limicola]GLH73033.1 hypothetical protein GETHLI_15350 [Geothrix limicola]